MKMEGEKEPTSEWSTTFSVTAPYLSALVQFGHPALLEVQEVRL